MKRMEMNIKTVKVCPWDLFPPTPKNELMFGKGFLESYLR